MPPPRAEPHQAPWHTPHAELSRTPCPGTVSCQQDASQDNRRHGRVLPLIECTALGYLHFQSLGWFSGFVSCCYFSLSETCSKRNLEALSPAAMFALTQFGTCRAKATSQRSRLLLPTRTVTVTCIQPDPTAPGPNPTATGAGAAPPPRTSRGHVSGWFYPRGPHVPHLKLLPHSAQCFSLVSERTVQTQPLGDRVTPAHIPPSQTTQWWQPQLQSQADRRY